MARSRLGLRLLEQALESLSLDPRELVGFWRVGFPDRDWHNPRNTGALYFAAEL